jgi:hypothetical protein
LKYTSDFISNTFIYILEMSAPRFDSP